jgi:hypothetical protein
VRTAQNEDPNRRTDAPPAPHDDWVHLRPGPKRIDELADFIEWIANARPEDEQAIRAEIKRYFCDVGDQASCNALNAHLTALLKPGITRDDRQRILDLMDIFTRADPAEAVHVRDWTTAGALAIGGVPPASATGRAGTEAAATEGVAAERATAEASAVEAREAPSKVWTYGWAKRGREIHEMLGDGSLRSNFPVIDMISPSGVVTSIKSIDLRAAVYQNDVALTYRLNNYLDKLSEFEGAKYAGQTVSPDQITGRVLYLVVPKGRITDAQRIIIEAAKVRGKSLGCDVVVTAF